MVLFNSVFTQLLFKEKGKCCVKVSEDSVYFTVNAHNMVLLVSQAGLLSQERAQDYRRLL